MRFDKIMRTVGPLVVMAALSGMAGKGHRPDIRFNGRKFRFGEDGMPRDAVALADLDLDGEVPREVALLGPDHVVITHDEDFAIAVQGPEEARAQVRFILAGDTLTVLRADPCEYDGEPATIAIAMPAPARVTIAGSGQLGASALADKAEVVIAGSGGFAGGDIAVEKLDVTIAGSGTVAVGGTADKLSLTVAGSGQAEMAHLLVEKAEIDIAGSGDAVFGCDGKVKATIMGSGHVTVRGSPRCQISSMGSGTLTVEPRDDDR